MKFWITVIVLTLLALPQAMAQQVDADDRRSAIDADTASADRAERELKNIKSWLSHIHRLPTRAELEQASDRARALVYELATDEETFLFHRQRALRALAYWPDEELRTLYLELLHDESTERGLLFHILPAMADAFGEEAIDDLRPFLSDDDDPHIRISAAYAIASIPGDRGQQVLRQAQRDEHNPIVKARLDQLSMTLR